MKRLIVIPLVCLSIVSIGETSRAEDAPTPPPPRQYTADCSQPVYATDRLVCGDLELRVLDDDLRALLRDRGKAISSPYIEPDADWFKRRSLCAFQADHKDCVRGAYAERLAVLRVIAMSRPVEFEPVRCSGVDASGMGRVGDALLLYDEKDQPIVVSFPADAHRPWKDFTVYSRKAKRLSLAFVDGRSLRCDVKPTRR